MSKPTLEIFTGTQNFGRVYKETNQINVKFIEFNMLFSDTTGNTAVNARGKTRLIMLQGANDGTGWDGATPEAKIEGFIQDVEVWVRGYGETGSIQQHIEYTDSFGTIYDVYCVDWTWTRSFNDPNRVLWSLMLKQA